MRKGRKSGKRVIGSLYMCFIMLFSMNVNAATQKADAKNMQKTIKYIQKNKYALAAKYNNRLSQTAKEKSTLKMSPAMKKAYLKVIKQHPVNGFGTRKVIRNYYLTDMDQDKKADLLILTGSCEQDTRLTVYRYRKGRAKKAGTIDAMHTQYSAYPNHRGIIEKSYSWEVNSISLITIRKNRLVREHIATMKKENYINIRCELQSHYRSSGYGYSYNEWLDTSDLR